MTYQEKSAEILAKLNPGGPQAEQVVSEILLLVATELKKDAPKGFSDLRASCLNNKVDWVTFKH